MSALDTDGPVDPPRPLPHRRILALSGGGYRGLFTASVLARLEEDSGQKIRDLFDLVIGTSAGAMVAAGVACGVAAADIGAAFQAHGQAIFPHRFMADARRFVHRAPYRAEPLQAALVAILGANAHKKMAGLQADLAVTAVSQTHAEFRLYAAGRFAGASSKDLPLSEAILASAAAPTYFPPRVYDQETLVDGGLVANAPEMAGIGLLRTTLGVPLERIRILSVGTASPGTGRLPLAANPLSIIGWMWPRRNLVLLTLDVQEQLARHLARQLLAERYCAIDVLPSAAQAKVMGALDCASPEASEALLALADRRWQDNKKAAYALLDL